MPGTPSRTADRHPQPLAPAVAVAVAFTIVVVAVPSVRFAYENLSLHIALETAEGMVAALVAALVGGRYLRTHQRSDLLLAASFVVLAATNLLVSAMPAAAASERPSGFLTWLALALRLLAVGGLAAAAFESRVVRGPPGRRLGRLVLLVVAAASLAAILASSAAAFLAEPVDPSLDPGASGRPLFEGHPAALTSLGISVVLHAAATIGFARQAAVRGDELLEWLAAGAAVSGFARLHYLLYPSLYTEWVYTGDLLRLGAYVLFLAGAWRALARHWVTEADLAVAEERRALARELHDGLIQELSFIRSHTVGRSTLDGPIVGYLADASERGLAEVRLALDALAADDRPLLDAMRATVEPLCARAGCDVRVSGDDGPPLSATTRHEILRVVQEASSNAVRHGCPDIVRVVLREDGDGLEIEVSDDGSGFDPDVGLRAGGYGLRSMRERVEALGGRFELRSAPGAGTTISAFVPVRAHDD